jgi:hypothetical protein
LFSQVPWHAGDIIGDQNPVVRAIRRQPVANGQVRPVTGVRETRADILDGGGIRIDRESRVITEHVREHRGAVTEVEADLQDPLPRPDVQILDQAGNHRRRTDVHDGPRLRCGRVQPDVLVGLT